MPFVPYGRGRSNLKLEVAPSKMKFLTRKLLDLQKCAGLPIAQMPFECLMSSPPLGQVDSQNASWL